MWNKLLTEIFPDDLQCPICSLYKKLNHLGICEACQALIEVDNSTYQLPYIDKLISTYNYNSSAQQLINRYKRENQRYLANFFAKICVEVLKNADIYIDCITWVPTSRAGLWQRGCDQAADIAIEIAKLLAIPARDLLVLDKPVKAQKMLNAEARMANMQDAFRCGREISVGEHILIVDDIMTTGATLQNAAKALLEANSRITVYGLAVFYATKNT